MKEDFMHFVWQYQLFTMDHTDQDIRVLHPGYHNIHEGPDFLHAKILVDGIEWNGHVELHVKSSDWMKHRHQDNAHYKNVILHVVHEDDSKPELSCPTVALKGKIRNNIDDQYLDWLNNHYDIPCAYSGLQQISLIKRMKWIDRLIIERCDAKYAEWQDIYYQVNSNWRQMIWVKVAESFGMKYNNVAFRHLAMNIHISLLDKLCDDLELIEAYLFGISGLIPEQSAEDYVIRLKENFNFIRHRYPPAILINMPWNFLRMRPANFPTIRLSQLAKLLQAISHLPQNLMSKNLGVRDLEKILDVEVSSYWQTHYVFGKESAYSIKKLGKTAIHSIIINAVIPLHYFHGKIFNDHSSISHAFHLLQELKPEKNSIIDRWISYGHKSVNAYESQSYIHLYNNYCLKRKCANCQFGQKILIS